MADRSIAASLLAASGWLLSAVALAAPPPANAPFPLEVEATSARDERVSECERRARLAARKRALDHIGQEVISVFFDLQTNVDGKDGQAVADYALTLQSALIALDFDAKRDFSFLDDGAGVRCKLKATARFLGQGRPDPAFQVQGLRLDQPGYFVGQKAAVSFKVTRDAYVYLLNVDDQENVTLLLPNHLVAKPLRVKGGDAVRFPDPKTPEGLELVAALAEGVESSVELLHVIAVRDVPDLFLLADTNAKRVGPYNCFALGRMDDVVKRLAGLNRRTWSMAVVPFSIRRR